MYQLSRLTVFHIDSFAKFDDALRSKHPIFQNLVDKLIQLMCWHIPRAPNIALTLKQPFSRKAVAKIIE
jgi:hypothetical protein